MKKIAYLLLSALVFPTVMQAKEYTNDKYTVQVSDRGEIAVRRNGSQSEVVFRPDFRVAYLEKAPRCSMQRIEKQGLTDNLNYRTFTWDKESDMFKVLVPEILVLEQVDLTDTAALFLFRPTEQGTLKATLTLPASAEEPLLRFEYKTAKSGYYSIGYCGAPETDPAQSDELWQPLVWTQKRFPGKSYLTPDFLCSMPLTAVRSGGRCYAVVVDPQSFPFSPLPTLRTFRFGVMLRNAAGQAQPMIWAPIAGSRESKLSQGTVYSLGIRLVVDPRSMSDMHEDLAMNLYGLKSYHRDNQLGVNLNTTIDNMIDYGMSQYSWFISEMKGCSYETDVKNAVKNSTALNPLNLAVVTDNEAIYRERFLPMCEFMLSRSSLLFALEPKQGIDKQIPSHTLGKPVMNSSEASALYEATGRQSDFLIDNIVAEKSYRNNANKAHERYWRENLAQYHATGDKAYLNNARTGADQYIQDVIERVQDKFDYKDQSASSFWTSLSPRFPELYNLWMATGEKKYLEAARYAARRYAQFIWMCPAIPAGKITVNKGGVAPKQKPWGEPLRVPEESVDCWRVSEIGLHGECGSTSYSHRGVFPAHYAAYMLKIAHAAGDDFLARIANWAVVGRYANFPGYHINTARTTAYEKPDFPLRTHYEMNVNSMHYNHIWPMMSILFDYLISDVNVKSDGAISFPSIFVEAFANLGSEMYGHAPGSFYGKTVQLWMPQQLVHSSDPQLNYLAAREGRDHLYLAFANQSLSPVTSTITLNPDLVKTANGTRLTLWKDNKPEGTITLRDGKFKIEVCGSGITAVRLENVRLNVGFQERMLTSKGKWEKDFAQDSYGRAMLFNFTGAPDQVYAYIAGTPGQYKRVGMSYRINGGKWTDILDCSFPFEFSVLLPEGSQTFEYKYTLVDKDNKPLKSSPQILLRTLKRE